MDRSSVKLDQVVVAHRSCRPWMGVMVVTVDTSLVLPAAARHVYFIAAHGTAMQLAAASALIVRVHLASINPNLVPHLGSMDQA